MKQLFSNVAKHTSVDDKLESIPDIANQVTDLETVLAWIDKLIEVKKNDKDFSVRDEKIEKSKEIYTWND